MAEKVPYEPLTAREREILTLLGQNLSDRAIADRLFVAPTTVKWFNRQIFRKLGVENRKQALQCAVELGLLATSEPDTPAPRHNLPAALTPFIGRSVELAEVRQLIAHPHTRLVTILGPGGMGKTRLALEAGEALLSQFSDGAHFVPLSEIISPDHIVPAIAEALNVQTVPDGRTPAQQVVDFLRPKHLLLILDNFEHLLDAAPLISDLLTAATHVKVLTTSRERLSVTGEVAYPLAGIDYPDAATDEPLRYGAAQLFVECALRANPQFKTDDAESIARICRITQGMPLAIELAAAWSGMLRTSEITLEIEQSADFLRTAMRDVPERLRSIRAVFEAAWARLDEDVRRAFRRMAVFRGGCTREAAQAVAGASLPTLAALVDKALLWRNTQTERYEVHELLRQYAEAELEQAGEAEAARQAHQEYYAAFTTEWTALLLTGRQQEAYAAIDTELENIRLAFARASRRGIPAEIELFADLAWYYDRNIMWDEMLTSFQAAIDRLEAHDSVALGRLLIGMGMSFMRQLKNEQMRDANRRAMAILERLGAHQPLALATVRYGIALTDLGEPDEAEWALREGLRLAEATGEHNTAAIAVMNLGNLATSRRQLEQGKAYLADAIRRYGEIGNMQGMCHALVASGGNALAGGDIDAADRLFMQTKTLAESIGFRFLIDGATWYLGRVACERGDWEGVRRFAQDRWQHYKRVGQSTQVVLSTAIQLATAAIMLGDTSEARRAIAETIPLMNDAMWTAFFVNWRIVAGRYLVGIGSFDAAAPFVGGIGEQINATDLLEADRRIWRETYDACRAALSPEEFAAAVERGKTLTPEAAIAELIPFL